MPGSVVDTSVLAAIVFHEPQSEDAVVLLRGRELYAPLLTAYELTSVAYKKSLRYPQKRAALSEALEVALAMDIRWVDVDHQGVLRIALDSGLTTYDASYLYLSRFLGVPLITFDEVLQAAAGSVEH
ncbi:MAG: type II toxin-antitoxin system VapC family toxin [Chloroflexi bacterium]|nr:type II toxin-antitoxin system VapC family toxin [Chloroflexota bacterium]